MRGWQRSGDGAVLGSAMTALPTAQPALPLKFNGKKNPDWPESSAPVAAADSSAIEIFFKYF